VSGDARPAAAESLLHEHGVTGARVTAEGPEREIAAVRVAGPQWERMMAAESATVVTAIRALGFRYVALDLLEAPPGE
jgi:PP-loop superfamily ATP-utilizing enzyme